MLNILYFALLLACTAGYMWQLDLMFQSRVNCGNDKDLAMKQRQADSRPFHKFKLLSQDSDSTRFASKHDQAASISKLNDVDTFDLQYLLHLHLHYLYYIYSV